MHKIYLASPLFNERERDFNNLIVSLLETEFEVFLPQRDGLLLTELLAEGIDDNQAKQQIFDQDTQALNSCDYLLIVLDGASIDEGAAFELGYAFSKGKKCFGLQTDSRRLLSTGNNPMIDKACLKIFSTTKNITNELLNFIKN
jgi:nucleoside 2-deoxyribosyltransferase